MKRCLCVLCLMAVVLMSTAAAASFLSITGEPSAWSWQAGEQQRTLFVIEVGDADLEDVKLTLSAVSVDGEEAGEAIFVMKDKRPLGRKDQTAEMTIKSLAAGSRRELTAAWTPDKALYDAAEAQLTLTFVGLRDGQPVTVAETVRISQAVNTQTASSLALWPGWSVKRLCLWLAAACCLTALLAWIRIHVIRSRG